MTREVPWTNRYKDDWPAAMARMQAWWNGEELDRPLVISPVPATAGRDWVPPPADAPELGRRDTDTDFQILWKHRYLEAFHFPAEAAPSVWTHYGAGLGMVAVAAGWPIHYAPGTAWIEENPDVFAGEPPSFVDHPAQAFVLDMLRRYDTEFGRDAVLGANHLLDPLTTLSMVRGPENLCMDLIERPETVKRFHHALTDIWLRLTNDWRAAKSRLGRWDDFHPIGVWANGSIEALQCDFCTMLSPAMFREFVRPEAERQAAAIDYPLWHLDGTAEFRHLDDICAIPNLRAIQWVDEDHARSPLAFIDMWEKVREHGKGLVIATTVAEAVEITRQLGPGGLAFRLRDLHSLADFEQAIEGLKP